MTRRVISSRKGGRSGGISIAIAEQTAKIIELRKDGLSLPQVSHLTGVPQATIRKRIDGYIRATITPSIAAFREAEMQRMEELEGRLREILLGRQPYISAGQVTSTVPEIGDDGQPTGRQVRVEDVGPVLSAAEKLIKLAERRAKLMGSDRAPKSDPAPQGGAGAGHAMTKEEMAAALQIALKGIYLPKPEPAQDLTPNDDAPADPSGD